MDSNCCPHCAFRVEYWAKKKRVYELDVNVCFSGIFDIHYTFLKVSQKLKCLQVTEIDDWSKSLLAQNVCSVWKEMGELDCRSSDSFVKLLVTVLGYVYLQNLLFIVHLFLDHAKNLLLHISPVPRLLRQNFYFPEVQSSHEPPLNDQRYLGQFYHFYQ